MRVRFRLTEVQARVLRDRARSEGRPVADLIGEAVDRFPIADREALVRRAAEALGRHRSGLPDLAEDHDRYLAEDFDP